MGFFIGDSLDYTGTSPLHFLKLIFWCRRNSNLNFLWDDKRVYQLTSTYHMGKCKEDFHVSHCLEFDSIKFITQFKWAGVSPIGVGLNPYSLGIQTCSHMLILLTISHKVTIALQQEDSTVKYFRPESWTISFWDLKQIYSNLLRYLALIILTQSLSSFFKIDHPHLANKALFTSCIRLNPHKESHSLGGNSFLYLLLSRPPKNSDHSHLDYTKFYTMFGC